MSGTEKNITYDCTTLDISNIQLDIHDIAIIMIESDLRLIGQ